MMNPFVSRTWPEKLWPKIDIFVNGKHVASSRAYEGCRDACAGYAWRHEINIKNVSAHYAGGDDDR